MIESLSVDIWRMAPFAFTVIPTNIGWTKDGRNVMGRGLARQAAERFPALEWDYGRQCATTGAATPVTVHRYGLASGRATRLILFPVKPLLDPPHSSWRGPATLDLIERSTNQLANLFAHHPEPGLITVPLVGCGNGGLKEEDVLPILRVHLSDRFVLVRPPV